MRFRAAAPGRRTLGVLGALLLLSIIALGPRVRFSAEWVEPRLPDDLDAWLAVEEARVPGIREDDERAIVWADPGTRGRTALSIVYLHGFSADRHEIEPVVSDLAAEVGANAYFSRLAGHGRSSAAMADATVEAWLGEAVEALAIGERIGDRVVVIGTSTGGTLATWLAARPESRGRVAALVLVSPNYQPKDHGARVLLYPWGTWVARRVVGPERCFDAVNVEQGRHWTTCYPTGALATMMALVEHVRTMDVSMVEAPTLVLYSPDDGVVDADETERLVQRMRGGVAVLEVVQSTSDPAHHVLAGDIVSPDSNAEVLGRIKAFLIERAIIESAAADANGEVLPPVGAPRGSC